MSDVPAPVGEAADSAGILRIAMWVWFVDVAVYGVALLFAPTFVVETLGGDAAFNYFWIRWSGGFLLGIAVAAWRAIQSPAGQDTLVFGSGVAGLLAGVGLVWGALAGEYGGATWFLWLTYVSSIGAGGFLLWARSRAGEVLA